MQRCYENRSSSIAVWFINIRKSAIVQILAYQM